MKQSFTSLVKSIGPGFLLAGVAIGVSHLVQATRAGAEYGFVLIGALIIACLTKYPFMEFEARYTSATGKSLIEGYKGIGQWALQLYFFVSIGSAFITQVAVTLVTAGLAEYLFRLGISIFGWSCIILSVCIIILWLGRYKTIDRLMKLLISGLTIATLIAVFLAIDNEKNTKLFSYAHPDLWQVSSIAFIIAFMGWMPIPVDASVWHSIWTKEKNKQYLNNSTKNSLIDFNIGYLSASFIGLLFFLLGVLVFFGREIELSTTAVGFSGQLIEMYQYSIGEWSKTIIAIAAFFAMFSTTLAVTDAYPRVFDEYTKLQLKTSKQSKYRYVLFLFLISILSLGLLYFFSNSFTVFVDFATGLAFLTSPIIAWLNLKLVTTDDFPQNQKLKPIYLWFSRICLWFLVCFGLFYLGFHLLT
ncbi:Nramp family divalent metal transporter [Flavobacterium sp. CS20]|uniref:Nramp family divalent metal transporter n=1 Tax=Flavobacterium sp. CS20 TaxID=2775246 RepID=UPI001B3A045B|nr:Nramp family divalent metal transporter [Flavobacterium sp. CS20]QTY27779.1 Nramp family divalent metal transporter [Flavobacterium sp. CS20]